MVLIGIWEFPKIRGTLFWGPENKDPSINLGYYIRVPYFRKLPYHRADMASRVRV